MRNKNLNEEEKIIIRENEDKILRVLEKYYRNFLEEERHARWDKIREERHARWNRIRDLSIERCMEDIESLAKTRFVEEGKKISEYCKSENLNFDADHAIEYMSVEYKRDFNIIEDYMRANGLSIADSKEGAELDLRKVKDLKDSLAARKKSAEAETLPDEEPDLEKLTLTVQYFVLKEGRIVRISKKEITDSIKPKPRSEIYGELPPDVMPHLKVYVDENGKEVRRERYDRFGRLSFITMHEYDEKGNRIKSSYGKVDEVRRRD